MAWIRTPESRKSGTHAAAELGLESVLEAYPGSCATVGGVHVRAPSRQSQRTQPQPWTDLRHWVARLGADSAEIVGWIAAAGGHVGESPDKWRIPRAYLPTRLKSEPEALEWLLACVLGAGFTVWQVDDDMPWPAPVRDTPFGPTLPPDPGPPQPQPKPPGTPWRPRP